MDAIACVGVAPPQSALLSRSFADAAIARALHFSLSDAAVRGAGTPRLRRGHLTPMGIAAPSPSSSTARCRLGPAGGHAGKRRRPRPSKRVPTTYISTDAATFRVMVQRVTGADEADLQLLHQHDGDLGLGLLLPHQLGVEQFLHAGGPAAHAAYTAAPPAVAEPQPLFPTLDSWNVMYGKKNVPTTLCQPRLSCSCHMCQSTRNARYLSAMLVQMLTRRNCFSSLQGLARLRRVRLGLTRSLGNPRDLLFLSTRPLRVPRRLLRSRISSLRELCCTARRRLMDRSQTN